MHGFFLKGWVDPTCAADPLPSKCAGMSASLLCSACNLKCTDDSALAGTWRVQLISPLILQKCSLNSVTRCFSQHGFDLLIFIHLAP